MGKPLTKRKIAETIEQTGFGKLPSGCYFISLNKEGTEDVVIAPGEPMPRIFYLKADERGEIIAFKAM